MTEIDGAWPLLAFGGQSREERTLDVVKWTI